MSKQGPEVAYEIKSIGNYKLQGVLLGKGNFARVELGTHRIVGAAVALKIINTKADVESYVLRNLYREAKILSRLKHRSIIKLYEVLSCNGLYCMALECVGGGDLGEFIRNQQNKKLLETESKGIFYQLLSAILYMHDCGILHRDLKLENVLMVNERVIKLADYGLSNFYNPKFTLNTRCGSPEYAAPELFSSSAPYGAPVDVWSAGVILYVMVVGKVPFQYPKKGASVDERRKTLHSNSSKGLVARHFDLMKLLSRDCQNLINSLLNPDQHKRLQLKRAVFHKWFTPDEVRTQQEVKDLHQPRPDLHNTVLRKLCAHTFMDEEKIENLTMADKYGPFYAMYHLLRDAMVKSPMEHVTNSRDDVLWTMGDQTYTKFCPKSQNGAEQTQSRERDSLSPNNNTSPRTSVEQATQTTTTRIMPVESPPDVKEKHLSGSKTRRNALLQSIEHKSKNTYSEAVTESHQPSDSHQSVSITTVPAKEQKTSNVPIKEIHKTTKVSAPTKSFPDKTKVNVVSKLTKLLPVRQNVKIPPEQSKRPVEVFKHQQECKAVPKNKEAIAKPIKILQRPVAPPKEIPNTTVADTTVHNVCGHPAKQEQDDYDDSYRPKIQEPPRVSPQRQVYVTRAKSRGGVSYGDHFRKAQQYSVMRQPMPLAVPKGQLHAVQSAKSNQFHSNTTENTVPHKTFQGPSVQGERNQNVVPPYRNRPQQEPCRANIAESTQVQHGTYYNARFRNQPNNQNVRVIQEQGDAQEGLGADFSAACRITNDLATPNQPMCTRHKALEPPVRRYVSSNTAKVETPVRRFICPNMAKAEAPYTRADESSGDHDCKTEERRNPRYDDTHYRNKELKYKRSGK